MFRKAMRINPKLPNIEKNLANALAANGDPDGAIDIYQRLLGERPDDPDLNFNLGVTLVEARRLEEGATAYRRVLKKLPGAHEADTNLGNLLSELGHTDEAREHLQRAARARPDDLSIQYNLAVVHSKTGAMEDVESRCRDILARDPDHEDALVLLATTLRYAGRFDEARSLIAQLRSKNPKSYLAVSQLSLDQQHDLTDEEIDDIEAVAADPGLSDDQRATLLFSLGGNQQKRGEHEAAFRFFQEANRLTASGFPSPPQNERNIVDIRISAFSENVMRSGNSTASDDARPVFIVGMPRSGTTLIEQIVASHPEAKGAGELSTITEIVEDLPRLMGSALPYPDCIGELTSTVSLDAAERYSDRISRVSKTARIITDKMPANYFELGLIALLLPESKVIHCMRDPRATCMSIYFQNFKHSHPYAYDLNRIGLRYHHYLRIIRHWREVLSIPILEVDYEALVNDTEAVSRRMLEFCDLGWDDRVLNFHETERVVRTASMWQVRKPIYRDSLALWKHYERHLEPLEQGLAGKEI